MPSLTDTAYAFFLIGAWIGFTAFTFAGLVGGWLIWKIVMITARVAYARWRWKKFQREVDVNGNLLLAKELAEHFIRENNKTAATEPKVNPYAPLPAQPTAPTAKPNDNARQPNQTRRSRSP
jgi:hypothetical protein